MGWEVYPAGLTEVLEFVASRTGDLPLYVTENGAAYPADEHDPTRDPERVSYLRRHLEAALAAIERGVPLRGYFVLVAARQLRVGVRLRPPVRHRPRGLRDRGSGGSATAAGSSRPWPGRDACRRPKRRRPTTRPSPTADHHGLADPQPITEREPRMTARPDPGPGAAPPTGTTPLPGTTGVPGPAPIPWEDRPAGSAGVLWRSGRNPIIARDLLPRSNSIFNSAVVPFRRRVRRRVPGRRHRPDDEPPRRPQPRRDRLADRSGADRLPAGRRPRGGDPGALRARLRPAGDLAGGPLLRHLVQRLPRPDDRPGLDTYDFETFHQLDNAFLPFNRNGVLFPRRIGGSYAMLSRPSDNGHTPFGDIYLLGEPRPRPLGPPPPRDGTAAVELAVHQGRRRTDADRDGAGLAAHLPRRADVLQRLRLLDGGGAPRPRPSPGRSSPAAATTSSPRRSRTSRWATSRTSSSPAPPSSIAAADRLTIYYGGADTVVCMAHGFLSEVIEFVRSRS